MSDRHTGFAAAGLSDPIAADRQDRRARRRAFLGASLASVLAAAVIIVPTALMAESAPAQQEETSADYVPESGQPGKDVVWVPTPQAVVDRMLDMAEVTPDDYVVDLGSGDGRTVITAAQRGARAHGIEYNPDLVALSKRNAKAAGVEERATFEQADLFASDVPRAQVVTLFLLPELNERLRPQLLEFDPGTRIVSNSFLMGDWTPDQTVQIEGCSQWCTVHLWIVPAKVEGAWRLGEQELRLSQTYQTVTGTLGATPIENGRLDGNRISFTAGGVQYSGTVAENSMSGSVSGGAAADWAASKS